MLGLLNELFWDLGWKDIVRNSAFFLGGWAGKNAVIVGGVPTRSNSPATGTGRRNQGLEK